MFLSTIARSLPSASVRVPGRNLLVAKAMRKRHPHFVSQGCLLAQFVPCYPFIPFLYSAQDVRSSAPSGME
jgi:hypothetical protein